MTDSIQTQIDKLTERVAELRRIVDTLANRVRELDARTFHNAPADRPVVTDAMVREAIASMIGYGIWTNEATWQRTAMRGAIEAALRAAPAGADTPGEES